MITIPELKAILKVVEIHADAQATCYLDQSTGLKQGTEAALRERVNRQFDLLQAITGAIGKYLRG